jgi:hypothetical protein
LRSTLGRHSKSSSLGKIWCLGIVLNHGLGCVSKIRAQNARCLSGYSLLARWQKQNGNVRLICVHPSMQCELESSLRCFNLHSSYLQGVSCTSRVTSCLHTCPSGSDSPLNEDKSPSVKENWHPAECHLECSSHSVHHSVSHFKPY